MSPRIAALSLVFFLFTPLPGQTPLSYDALYSFPTPQSVEPSPDGRWILYSVGETDTAADTSRNSLWLMDSRGGAARRLYENAYGARWLPDGGAVTFISYTDGSGQLYRLEPAGGKVERLTRVPGGIDDYVRLPDGSGILCIRTVRASDGASPAPAAAGGKAPATSAMVYDRLLFRPYNRWDDGTVTHVFHYRFADGRLTDLTPGPHSAPASHLGGDRDVAVSPDGRTVAYTSDTSPVKAVSTNNDIFLVNIDGTNRRRLTTNHGNDVNPIFSPDGRRLVYTEMATPGYESEQKDLILVDLQTDTRRNLTVDFDLSPDEILWSRRGEAIFVTCKEKGFDSLYRFDLPGGKPVCLARGAVFTNVTPAADGKSFLCITSTLDRPAEIARFDLVEQRFTSLTHLADGFVSAHTLARTEVFRFHGAGDDEVMGFLTRPEPFDAGRKYPLLFLFHGGPEGDWDGSWSNYGGNVHLFASRGYVVVKLNIHGAASYGRRFLEAILNNWGRVDQEDVMRCIDHLTAAYPFIDGKRIGALGRSYGGFLVNWLNGNTDRFSCFVSIDGLFDQLMFYYSCDELWFPEKEFGGTPMSNRAEYLRASPSTYAHNFKTPTLVLHGGRDYRVDPSQGIAMFTALQRQGVPSRFVYFPDEPHYYRRHVNWKYAYEEIFAWLAKYLGG